MTSASVKEMVAAKRARFDAVALSQAVGQEGNNLQGDRSLLAKHIRGIVAQHGKVVVGGTELVLELVSPSIGTIVHGADLAKPLSPEMLDFLRRLWLQRRVIFFRGQSHLTQQNHVDLANQFGVIGAHHGERDWVPENEMIDLARGTVDKFPDVLKLYANERAMGAAAVWHSDVMWSSRPPMGSMLLARHVPPVGGDTCFCDMYAMWEGLRPETRLRLQGLSAVNVGGPQHKKDNTIPTAVHPCAVTHPETGGTALFVSPGFTKQILGVPEAEGRKLLRECHQQAGRPEYCCRFKWEEGSLAFWDNRACMHYATPDFWPHTRRMERVTVLDKDESKKVPRCAGIKANL